MVDGAEEIREKYKQLRAKLDDDYAKDLIHEGIARRKLVLLRQKELLEANYLINDKNEETGITELEWINKELIDGILLVNPHDPFPQTHIQER